MSKVKHAKFREVVPQEPLVMKTFKASPDEVEQILENAEKHTRGNVSAWVRDAALNYKPKKRVRLS